MVDREGSRQSRTNDTGSSATVTSDCWRAPATDARRSESMETRAAPVASGGRSCRHEASVWYRTDDPASSCCVIVRRLAWVFLSIIVQAVDGDRPRARSSRGCTNMFSKVMRWQPRQVEHPILCGHVPRARHSWCAPATRRPPWPRTVLDAARARLRRWMATRASYLYALR